MARNLRRNGETPAPVVPPPPGTRQVNLNVPERQMMVRIWALEDELRELQQANADLQTALGYATAAHAVPVPGPDLTASEQPDV